jgi:putative transposase
MIKHGGFMSWSDLRKGRYSHEQGEYFVTFNTQNREPYFHDFNLACLFSQQIIVNETKHNCVWLAWVLMPDHFHGLLRLNVNGSTLPNVIKGLKGSASFILNKECNQQKQFWQSSFYDRALRVDENRKNLARYILANPLRKRLVNNIANYSFWNSVYL